MRKKSDTSSLFKVLGITPQSIIILIIGLVFAGVILGLLVKNSSKIKKKTPASKISINKMETIKEQKSKEIISEFPNNQMQDIKKDIPPSKPITQLIENTPFNENKLIFSKKVKTPVVAIVIDDMGVDMLRSNKLLNIPEIYTVAFLTYAPNLQSQINFAKTKGKEILLHVPMEATNNIYDYGPEVLTTKNSHAINLELLNSMLERVSGYIGINNHMGSKFTADLALLSGVIEELSKKGLCFLDSKTTPLSKADEIVKHIKLPYATRDVFLDDSNKLEDIEKSLIKLEKIAKKKGFAVAIGHPRDNTIKALEKWLPSIKNKGLTSVPLSYIIDNYNN